MTNTVIAGDYKGKYIKVSFLGTVTIKGFIADKTINKDTVESYELVDSQTKPDSLLAGAFGASMIGPFGLFLGLGETKKVIAIKFKNGKKSLLEVDDPTYKALMKKLF